MPDIGRNIIEASRLEWSQPFVSPLDARPVRSNGLQQDRNRLMKEALRTLTAAFVLASVAGCAEPEPSTEMPADSETDLPAPSEESAAPQEEGAEPDPAPEIDAVAPSMTQGRDEPTVAGSAAAFDGQNSRFSIEGQTVVLRNGLSKVPAAPGSASSITTRYLGKVARGDLTGDGREDVAYFVTREGGG